MESFKIYIERADSQCLTLSAEGVLGNGDATAYLRSTTMSQLVDMRQLLIMDLTGLAAYDAAGLAGLKAFYRRARAAGTEVRLVNVPERLGMVFAMSLVFLQAEPFDTAFRA